MTPNGNDNQYQYWTEVFVGGVLIVSALQKIYIEPPDRDWLESLINDDVFTELPFGVEQSTAIEGLEFINSWCEENKRGISDQSFADLRADYTRLFIGPSRAMASPWESVYFNEDGMLFQEQTLKVRNWYREYGLQAENIYHEPDDHIGLELGFLAHLLSLGIQSIENQDEEGFRSNLCAQNKFLSEHLSVWAPAFCDRIIEHATTDFYRGVGLITKGILTELKKSYAEAQPRENVK